MDFVEESEPLYIGREFSLQDFDDGDMTGAPFNVSLTLTEAVDGTENEGLLFTTTGTEVVIHSSYSSSDPFVVEYVLTGSSSFSEYQQVNKVIVLLNCYYILAVSVVVGMSVYT